MNSMSMTRHRAAETIAGVAAFLDWRAAGYFTLR